jgi:hypothetical protein
MRCEMRVDIASTQVDMKSQVVQSQRAKKARQVHPRPASPAGVGGDGQAVDASLAGSGLGDDHGGVLLV